MSAVLSKEQIRARIDTLERLEEVMTTMSELANMEWEPGERPLVDVELRSSESRQSIAFTHLLPHSVVLAGYTAMLNELQRDLDATS